MPFSEDLVDVVVGLRHHIEDLRHVVVPDAFVEEVAHRVEEDDTRLLPLKRVVQPVPPKTKVKALLVGVARDASESFSERLRVAVGAASRHLVAARYGIPCGLSPFDCAGACHFCSFVSLATVPLRACEQM